MTYHYSRLQRLLWRIGDVIARLLAIGILIGIVGAGQSCGAGQIPVLEQIATVVTVEERYIDLEGAPVWGCAPARL